MSTSIDNALKEAESFLQPVLKREDFERARGASVVDRLFDSAHLDDGPSLTKQDVVVEKALSILETIHNALLFVPEDEVKTINTSSSRRLIDALLDLISLEGIYPCLLPGVGSPIERRVRSVLQGGTTIVDAKLDRNPRTEYLNVIADRLYNLVLSNHGVATAIQQRILVDLIAAILQLAYAPEHTIVGRWPEKLSRLVDSLPPTVLFPSFISLLHSTTPDWLKPHVTVPLSLLPMRRDGVRQTITFVARSTPQRPAPKSEQQDTDSGGPVLPIEVLAQVSKVLSAVPATVTPDVYFHTIGPQLLQLLEDRDPDAERAAAYTISHGILSKRQFGQPGSVGWQVFALPLLSVINPSLSPEKPPDRSSIQLTKALKALCTLLLIFPNPALSRRLLSPIVLPLWAILCVSSIGSMTYELSQRLLQHLISSAAGSKTLLTIADNFLYTGELAWKISSGPGQLKDVAIVERTSPSRSDELRNVDLIPPRIQQLSALVDACHDDTEFGHFFAGIFRRALNQNAGTSKSDVHDMLLPIVYAKIAQELLSNKTLRLMENVTSIVSVIEEVLKSQLTEMQTVDTSKNAAVNRLTLSSIVSNQERQEEGNSEVREFESALDICLPWLILVVQSGQAQQLNRTSNEIESLRQVLDVILYTSRISRASKETIRQVLLVLDTVDSTTRPTTHDKIDIQKHDLQIHAESMRNLQAAEPPIRVQGLSQLEGLVSRGSALVSTSSAVLTVLALLQDPDSFVYLSAIKVLVSLARKEPQSAIRTLQEAYQDITEQSVVDVRLRIGEALQTTIEETGPLIPPPALDRLVETLIHLASRRVYRAKTHQAQQKSAAIPRPVDADDDSDVEEDARKSERDLQSILDSWQGKSGAEDLRIRASSLTILGATFEYADFSIMSTFVPVTLEVIVDIVQQESGQENAIIRRAAVLVVLSMIKGQENAPRTATDLWTNTATNGGPTMETIEAILQTVSQEDDDNVVRGHAENVLKELQEWQQETINAAMRGENIRFGLEDQAGDIRLRGLDVNPGGLPTAADGRRPVIEELD